MASESKNGLTEQFTKENGKTIKQKERESLFIQMVTITKGNGKMIKLTVTECLFM